jgi:hypothetical protein
MSTGGSARSASCVEITAQVGVTRANLKKISTGIASGKRRSTTVENERTPHKKAIEKGKCLRAENEWMGMEEGSGRLLPGV